MVGSTLKWWKSKKRNAHIIYQSITSLWYFISKRSTSRDENERGEEQKKRVFFFYVYGSSLFFPSLPRHLYEKLCWKSLWIYEAWSIFQFIKTFFSILFLFLLMYIYGCSRMKIVSSCFFFYYCNILAFTCSFYIRHLNIIIIKRRIMERGKKLLWLYSWIFEIEALLFEFLTGKLISLKHKA